MKIGRNHSLPGWAQRGGGENHRGRGFDCLSSSSGCSWPRLDSQATVYYEQGRTVFTLGDKMKAEVSFPWEIPTHVCRITCRTACNGKGLHIGRTDEALDLCSCLPSISPPVSGSSSSVFIHRITPSHSRSTAIWWDWPGINTWPRIGPWEIPFSWSDLFKTNKLTERIHKEILLVYTPKDYT